jgi:hypothetical protein
MHRHAAAAAATWIESGFEFDGDAPQRPLLAGLRLHEQKNFSQIRKGKLFQYFAVGGRRLNCCSSQRADVIWHRVAYNMNLDVD